MANSSTVNTLLTTIRQRFDHVNSTTFDDTTELKPWIRDSLKQLYEIIVGRWQDWYTVPSVLTLKKYQESYQLPQNFRAMVQVYMLYTNNVVASGSPTGPYYREPLMPFTMKEYGRYTSQAVYVRQWPLLYRIMNQKIYFTPTSTMDLQNAIEYWYVPQWMPPPDDDMPIDTELPNGFEEWVVADVMIKMATKLRESDRIQPLQSQKAELLDRVKSGAATRNGDAPMMTDVYNFPRWTWLNSTPGGPANWSPP